MGIFIDDYGDFKLGWIGFIVAVIVVLIIGGVLVYRGARYHSIREVSFSITKLPNRDLQYNANGNKNAYANLVYTDKGTFQNSDSTFPWKQNSSDLYAMLEQGHRYRCEVAGWRLGIFSNYPDLIKCKETK